MTDGVEAERAERLARLNRRRSTVGQGTAGRTAGPGLAPPSVPVAPARSRRSPATTAKIVTVGASTTAVLGIMAGYGIAEQAAADNPVLLGTEQPETPTASKAATATVPPAATTPAITPATTPPQVIVVVIDGATDQRVSGDIDLSTPTATPPGAAGATPPALVADADSTAAEPAPAAPTPAPTAAPAAAPAPVAAPTAIDLAVPAPPPAPTLAPAPQPAATSSGS